MFGHSARSACVGAALTAAFISFACGGDSKDVQTSTPSAEVTATSASASTPVPKATSTPVPLVIASADRVVIPKIQVNAPLTLKVVGQDGKLENSDGPDDVAIYDFSKSFPGKYGGTPGSGNLVLYGASSKREKPKAVFWDVPTLEAGDKIQVVVAGQSYEYSVVSRCYKPRTSANFDYIYAFQPGKSVLTLETDAGRVASTNPGQPFSYGIVLVRAELTPGALEKACPGDESATPPQGLGGDVYGR